MRSVSSFLYNLVFIVMHLAQFCATKHIIKFIKYKFYMSTCTVHGWIEREREKEGIILSQANII